VTELVIKESAGKQSLRGLLRFSSCELLLLEAGS
jgi:hypothetical protein